MTTKFLTMVLSLGLSITSSNCGVKTQAQDSTVNHMVVPATVTKTQDAVDSVQLLKEQFVSQKEDLKSKVNLLQRKQEEMKRTQRELDSFSNLINTASAQ